MRSNMQGRILVTGSEGFVGKRLVDALQKNGYEVVEFDSRRGQDILNYEHCKKASQGCDAVIHCAAILDESSPMLWKVNVEGTENILKASSENKVERFIHLSSAGVHGKQKGIVTEESPFNPETEYEKTKMHAELRVQEFQELIHTTILRPAILLGPNEYWRKIFGLIRKNFPLIGSGKNKWQILYIDDLIDAILFCLANEETKDETFIVAEEKAITLEELCIEIKKALGMEPKLRKIPLWLAKPFAYLYIIFARKSLITPAHLERLARNREYSIEKIKSFGWKPKWDAKKAIRATAKALKEEQPVAK